MVLIDNYDDQKIQPRQDYEEDDVFPGASVMWFFLYVESIPYYSSQIFMVKRALAVTLRFSLDIIQLTWLYGECILADADI